MKRILIMALFPLTVMLANPAFADLDGSMDEMCVKMKNCSIAEIERQGLPPEMITMMSTMFDGMCKTWMGPYAKTIGDAGLEDKAEDCLDSVIETSCEDIMQSEGKFTTQACEDFKQAADEADLDLEAPATR